MDPESGKSVQSLPKGTFKKKIVLFSRTFVHTLYLIINMTALGRGLGVVISITGEQEKNPFISNLKWFCAAYGTNWNYVSL